MLTCCAPPRLSFAPAFKPRLDHAGTRVGQAEAAGTFLASNLINLGTDAAHIEAGLAQLNTLAAPESQPLQADQTARSDTVDAARPTDSPRVIVSPPVVTPAPSPTQLGPRLENITMASGVNEFDCAIDVTSSFYAGINRDLRGRARLQHSRRRDHIIQLAAPRYVKSSALAFTEIMTSTTIASGSTSIRPIQPSPLVLGASRLASMAYRSQRQSPFKSSQIDQRPRA